MNEGKDRRILAVLILSVCVAVLLWPPLIALKVAGITDLPWAAVLTSIVWIAWAVMTVCAIYGTILWLLKKQTRWHRRRKKDSRIIRQAKAAGVWDNPKALGGRGLELYAWKKHRLRRKPGEPDKELRRRIAATEADKRYDEYYDNLAEKYTGPPPTWEKYKNMKTEPEESQK